MFSKDLRSKNLSFFLTAKDVVRKCSKVVITILYGNFKILLKSICYKTNICFLPITRMPCYKQIPKHFQFSKLQKRPLKCGSFQILVFAVANYFYCFKFSLFSNNLENCQRNGPNFSLNFNEHSKSDSNLKFQVRDKSEIYTLINYLSTKL